MECIKSLLCHVFGCFTFILLLLLLPPFWLFKVSSFILRSFFPENVRGKVVLVTGASSGIGEHVAYEYAKRGARLALAARRKDRLVKVAEKAREYGSPDVLVVSADVSIPENCENMVQETINHFGTLDHLVNNAGIKSLKLLEEYSDIKEMESIMNTNFWGAIHATRHAIPHLRRSKGKIVVVSSVAQWTPSPRVAIYCGSKGALISVFEALRVEIGGDVKITLVSPGIIQLEDVNEPRDENSPEIRSSFPAMKVECCAKAIVTSVCRGDRDLTVPKYYLFAYYIKLFCPEFLELFIRFIIDHGFMEQFHQD